MGGIPSFCLPYGQAGPQTSQMKRGMLQGFREVRKEDSSSSVREAFRFHGGFANVNVFAHLSGGFPDAIRSPALVHIRW